MPGTGEINQDPQLVNPDAGDYLLTVTSPCINAGNPDPLLNDPDGSRNDMGAFFFPLAPTSVGGESSDGGPWTWSQIKKQFH